MIYSTYLPGDFFECKINELLATITSHFSLELGLNNLNFVAFGKHRFRQCIPYLYHMHVDG